MPSSSALGRHAISFQAGALNTTSEMVPMMGGSYFGVNGTGGEITHEHTHTHFTRIYQIRPGGSSRNGVVRRYGVGLQGMHTWGAERGGPRRALMRRRGGPSRRSSERQCSVRPLLDGSKKSGLEVLPQDILIRILSHVVHGDLKRLVCMSKTIKEATVVAKQWHFAYTMPMKIRTFRNSIDPQNSSDCKEIEAPNALLRTFRSCISRRKLVDVTTVLFASSNEGSGPREVCSWKLRYELISLVLQIRVL
ncbi:hypothetical protein NL676_039022 [Syzygium grande]|nr:hypothetical protein NL676_039022 [Syzygium grande]